MTKTLHENFTKIRTLPDDGKKYRPRIRRTDRTKAQSTVLIDFF
jgi:hypothetical protein